MYLSNGAVMAPSCFKRSSKSYSFFLAVKFSFLLIWRKLFLLYMNATTQSYSNVNIQLKELVNHYLSTHSGLTLNALAVRSGIPATTLRRIMSEENRTELAPHSVLSLVSYLLKEKRISFLLTKVEGAIGELLRKNFDQYIFNESSSDHKLDHDLNAELNDKTSYLIYKLAANKCGTSINEIKNLFGLTGMQKLNSLIEKNWIIADQSERFHAKEKNFSIALNLAQQHAHTLIDFYKSQDIDKGHNLFYSLSEGMNIEGIKKIKEVEKEAVKKIFDIMNDHEMQGSLPYFAIILSDILGFTPSLNEGVLQ